MRELTFIGIFQILRYRDRPLDTQILVQLERTPEIHLRTLNSLLRLRRIREQRRPTSSRQRMKNM